MRHDGSRDTCSRLTSISTKYKALCDLAEGYRSSLLNQNVIADVNCNQTPKLLCIKTQVYNRLDLPNQATTDKTPGQI